MIRQYKYYSMMGNQFNVQCCITMKSVLHQSQTVCKVVMKLELLACCLYIAKAQKLTVNVRMCTFSQ